ncbi:uncharacterized protein BXZ73DRAFT_45633 [Epithele typhae]|uniref:uncharacterized protein n=1 Tax=Epithele typhae TaxID=378194 RepID=UPI0020077AAC|nr:uncharacterized protein BXZ73DRAFT_45633 [Epithele typhae]KAH9935231.1 hypothetical protein BXZ73DRAFT_45633 [Epithele typhae]
MDGSSTLVINPSSSSIVAQGAGTDGSGQDFNLPAILWLGFAFAAGAPLALAGIRLWRVTTGLGVGLGVALGAWAAFVNTVSADGLPDLVLAIIVLGAFGVSFIAGVLPFGRWAGIILVGALGGMSIGFRVVLLRPGLLIPTYVLNWLVIVAFSILGLAGILVKQRVGVTINTAAIGSFLIALGVDLIIQKQDGLSFGLRFLLDRNDSHFLSIVFRGYNPSLRTQIVIGASLGATFILALLQYLIFKASFYPLRTQTDSDAASYVEDEPALVTYGGGKPADMLTKRLTGKQLLKSRFSHY